MNPLSDRLVRVPKDAVNDALIQRVDSEVLDEAATALSGGAEPLQPNNRLCTLVAPVGIDAITAVTRAAVDENLQDPAQQD